MSRLVNFRFRPLEDSLLTALAAREGLTKSETVRRLVVNAAATPEPVRRLEVAPKPEPVRKGKAPARP